MAMPDDKLAAWLMKKARRQPLVRSLSALEGFVTATVVGPSLPNPFIPLCAAVGVRPDVLYAPPGPSMAALAAAVVRFNDLGETLRVEGERFKPSFISKSGGGVDPRPWCQAFYAAVQLNQKAWKTLLDLDNTLHGLLLPILIYCVDDNGHPVLGPPRPGPETASFIEHEAHLDIAPVLCAIRDHYHTTHYADHDG
jgi:yecA family protein